MKRDKLQCVRCKEFTEYYMILSPLSEPVEELVCLDCCTDEEFYSN